MNVFALSFAMMLALVLAEQWVLWRRTGQPVPWVDLVFNLNSGHLLMWVLRGVEVAAYGFVLSHASVQWVSGWPVALQWLFAFVGWDLCFYWMHRMHHRIPLLWAVHGIHHQGEHFNLSLGIRNGWYSSLTNFPFIAGLAVLGVPAEIFVAVSSFHYGVQFYNHNALVGRCGALDRFMVTPSNHRVHHGLDPHYIDRNFGGTLLLWDRLFGTWQPERDDLPMQFGVAGGVPTQNPLWASNPAVWRWLGGGRGGRRELDERRWPPGYIGAGGVIVFLLVIGHVDGQGRWPALVQTGSLIGLVLSTIALGALSDGRRWGAVAWVLLCMALPAAFLADGSLPERWLAVPLALLVAHGLDGARRLLVDAKQMMPPDGGSPT